MSFQKQNNDSSVSEPPKAAGETKSSTSSPTHEEATSPTNWSWVSVLTNNNHTLAAASATTTFSRSTINLKDHLVTVDEAFPPSLFVQPELIPNESWDHMGMIKQRGHLEQYWLMIYAYLDLSYSDRIEMKCFCRLFHKVEHILTANKHCYETLTPIPLWTLYPHSSYSTLNELMETLSEIYAELPALVWEDCTAPEMLRVGMKVRDNRNVGIIQNANENGETFDIVYGDFDGAATSNDVPLNEIQIPNVSCF